MRQEEGTIEGVAAAVAALENPGPFPYLTSSSTEALKL